MPFLSHFQNVGKKDPFQGMNLKASTSPAFNISSYFGPCVGEFIRETSSYKACTTQRWLRLALSCVKQAKDALVLPGVRAVPHCVQ